MKNAFQILGEVFPEGSVSTYPCGQDVSGVVQKVGEGVTHVSNGDEVVGMFKLYFKLLLLTFVSSVRSCLRKAIQIYED